MLIPRSLLALSLLLLLAACGGDSSSAPRVEILPMPTEGPLPEGLVLVPTAHPERRIPLRPVGGDRYEAPGAPEGVFTVEGPGGWRTLPMAGARPEIHGLEVPSPVYLAPPARLFVLSGDMSLQPGRTWAAREAAPEDGDAPPRRLPVEVAMDPTGRLAALRFRPEDWRGRIEIQGYLAPVAAGPVKPENAGKGPPAALILVQAPEGGGAQLQYARPAGTMPVVVALISESDDPFPDDPSVELREGGLPLDLSWRAVPVDRIARFPRIARLGPPLAVGITGRKALALVPEATALGLEAIYLFVVRPDGARTVDLPGPPDLVLARPASAGAFALVPPEPATDGDLALRIRLPAVPTVLLLRRGRQWARVEVPAEGPPPLPYVYEEPARIQGTVSGAPRSGIVRLYRHEGEARVTGHLWTRRLGSGGDFSFDVPAGTYDVEVASDRGIRRRDHPLDATRPGAQLHLQLKAR